MSESIVFPYGITLRENGNVDTIPIAEVRFRDKKGEWLSLFLIIDSGATISALPKSDASVFGIDVRKGKEMKITGISGGELKGWQHSIIAQIGNEILELPVVFLESGVPSRVLGRIGVFEKFSLIFEERQKRTGFIKGTKKEAKIIQRILDKIQKETTRK